MDASTQTHLLGHARKTTEQLNKPDQGFQYYLNHSHIPITVDLFLFIPQSIGYGYSRGTVKTEPVPRLGLLEPSEPVPESVLAQLYLKDCGGSIYIGVRWRTNLRYNGDLAIIAESVEEIQEL